MKRVKMLATASGPKGVQHAGKFYTLEDDQAAAYIKAGAAREASKPEPKKKNKKEQKEDKE